MLLEDDEQFEHEEAWMEDCQEIYLNLSADTNDFLKEQLVLSQSAHEKGVQERLSLLTHRKKQRKILPAKIKFTLKTQLTRKGKRQFRLPLLSLLKNT